VAWADQVALSSTGINQEYLVLGNPL
jgi:hypothetical protein